MNTRNIGFYEDLTKIIFELSSNIIKYAPYFFCCKAPTTSEVKIAVLPKRMCTSSPQTVSQAHLVNSPYK